MQIYLPYNYSEDNQYDVLLLLHGGGGTSSDWLGNNKRYGVSGKQVLDNMIYYGDCDPLIVVSGQYDTNNYAGTAETIISDLLPYIVTNYNTYANVGEDASLEEKQQAIINARDHFNIAGYSSGGASTAYIAQNQKYAQFFSNYGIFSEPSYNNINVPQDIDINSIFFACGDGDGDKFTRIVTEPAYDSVKNNPNVNNSSLDIISGEHELDVWHTALYNMLLGLYGASDE